MFYKSPGPVQVYGDLGNIILTRYNKLMMVNQGNPWDSLGRKTFNTNLQEGEIDPRVADNVLIAWPVIFGAISKEVDVLTGRALDFGCGTGAFCIALQKLGFSVTGIDPSEEMIRIAKQNSPATVTYVKGDYSVAENGYKVISSIMVFQFIRDIETVFSVLIKSLSPGGILIFAVHNPDWVSECLKQGIGFSGFDSVINPTSGMKDFGDIHIPVFIRRSSEFDSLAAKYGLKKFLEAYPPFTQEFIEKYPDNRPKNIPEFLILGYKKD
ncbi:hypothetical protein A2Z33_02550 [Candidatus Gottesmanbacteria bacterium RBG_16_52_11]|uniref:Methyltransferase domain-containing protein n=1 Tax=Candidatus Gottesmanbacteria bacterium RBG_16_52_11 TaxID=1798374 RepID=A0A1F5YN49_9BACT|nr:MAG: hypothetical protein A2Z33_02550 [Candidatus Gottesmanbacteria bacterium RBG_16_52_11]